MIPQPIDTIPLFQRLSEEERQFVTARLKRRQAAPGELIISEGQPGETLFIITAGWVKLEGGDQKITLANLGAGSLLGEADMLQGRPYSMTARAAGTANTQLLTLARPDLEDLVNERPSIGLKFSASVGVRIVFLEEYLVQQRLLPVHKHLFVEANPIPLKWAMARMGLCQETLRLPMTPMSRNLVPLVEGALKESGLLS